MDTYAETINRAKYSARELLPAMPIVNTYEAWETYIEALEDFDTFDAAHTEAESWDTVIYYGKAIDLCTSCPSSVLHEAESQWDDCNNDKPEGLYELACHIAYWIVYNEISEAIETLRDELIELSQNQMENL